MSGPWFIQDLSEMRHRRALFTLHDLSSTYAPSSPTGGHLSRVTESMNRCWALGVVLRSSYSLLLEQGLIFHRVKDTLGLTLNLGSIRGDSFFVPSMGHHRSAYRVFDVPLGTIPYLALSLLLLLQEEQSKEESSDGDSRLLHYCPLLCCCFAQTTLRQITTPSFD